MKYELHIIRCDPNTKEVFHKVWGKFKTKQEARSIVSMRDDPLPALAMFVIDLEALTVDYIYQAKNINKS